MAEKLIECCNTCILGHPMWSVQQIFSLLQLSVTTSHCLFHKVQWHIANYAPLQPPLFTFVIICTHPAPQFLCNFLSFRRVLLSSTCPLLGVKGIPQISLDVVVPSPFPC